jgi:tetratricopeptide (TPR) repeat protein/DNA-binding CsgD family transcriptional regulator
MKKLILIFFAIIINLHVLSQDVVKLDSLRNVLSTSHDIETKIKMYLELSSYYKRIDIDSSRMMSKQALRLAKEIKSDKNIAQSYLNLGLLNVMSDSIKGAIIDYKNSLYYYKEVKDLHSQADVLIILGNLYFVVANYPEAMSMYSEALSLSKQSNYYEKLPFCYNNLGVIYFSLKDYNKALNYYTLALTIYEKQNDSVNIALAFGNIGSIYFRFGSFDIAQQYFLKEQKVYNELEDKDGIAQSLTQLASIYIKNNKPDSAIINLKKSIGLYNSMNFGYRGPKSIWVIKIYKMMGESYLMTKNYELAINQLMKGYSLATNTNQKASIVESSMLLSTAYDSLKLIDSSYKYFKIYKYFSDSVLNEEKIRKIFQIEFQSKLDQKMIDKEIEDNLAKAKQARTNLIYIIILFCLIFIIILFVLLLKLEKNKKAKIELEQIQLKKDLEFKNKEITTHVLYLLKKNEFILSISEKLKNIIPAIKVQNKKLIADVINELKSGTSNDTWKEFEIRFQQVHTSFYENLNDSYPTLTPNELRLCAFLRLNMTTKDIAAITYQSLNSIEIARTRLRKKLGLDKTDNLISFLNTL